MLPRLPPRLFSSSQAIEARSGGRAERNLHPTEGQKPGPEDELRHWWRFVCQFLALAIPFGLLINGHGGH